MVVGDAADARVRGDGRPLGRLEHVPCGRVRRVADVGDHPELLDAREDPAPFPGQASVRRLETRGVGPRGMGHPREGEAAHADVVQPIHIIGALDPVRALHADDDRHVAGPLGLGEIAGVQHEAHPGRLLEERPEARRAAQRLLERPLRLRIAPQGEDPSVEPGLAHPRQVQVAALQASGEVLPGEQADCRVVVAVENEGVAVELQKILAQRRETHALSFT